MAEPDLSIFADDPLVQNLQPEKDDTSAVDLSLFADDPLVKKTQKAAPAVPAVTSPEQDFPMLLPSQRYLVDKEQPEDLDTEPNELGFISALKGASRGAVDSAINVPATYLSGKFNELMQESFPGSDLANWAEQSAIEQKQLTEDNLALRENYPVSKTLQQLGGSETLKDFGRTLLESDEKWTLAKELMGGSLPFTLSMLAGGAYAKLPGVFSSVFIMDYGDSYRESLSQGKSEEEAAKDAFLKAGVQAGFDTTTFGLANVKLANSKILDMLGQLGIQALGGGGAEAAKHEVVGEDYKIGQVGVEALGELVGAPLEIMGVRGLSQKAKTLEEMKAEVKGIIERAQEEEKLTEREQILRAIDQEEANLSAAEKGLGWRADTEPTVIPAESIILDDTGKVNAEGTEKGLPVVEEGFTRLYTGDFVEGGTETEQKFVTDMKEAPGTISYLDVPNEMLNEFKGKDGYLIPTTTSIESRSFPINLPGEQTEAIIDREGPPRYTDKIAPFAEYYDETGEVTNLKERPLEAGEVKQVADDHFSSLYQKLETKRIEWASKLDQAQINEDAPARMYYKSRLENSQKQFEHLGAIVRAEKEGLSYAQKTLQNWVKKLSPTMKLLVGANKISLKEQQLGLAEDSLVDSSNITGHFFRMHNGTNVIELNVQTFVDKNGYFDKPAFIETMAHEFAHALMWEEYRGLPAEVRKALVKTWKKWFIENSFKMSKKGKSLKVRDLHKAREGGFTARYFIRFLKKSTTNLPTQEYFSYLSDKTYNYQLGMTEFFADQIAKQAFEHKVFAPEIRAFFKRLYDRLKKALNLYNQEFGASSTMKEFLDFLQAKAALDKARADLKAYDEKQTVEEEIATTQEGVEQTVGGVVEGANMGGGKPTARAALDEEIYPKNFRDDLDKYNRIIQYGANLLQIGKLNPHIKGVQTYIQYVKAWWNVKMTWTARADERLKQWKKLGGLRGKRAEDFGNFMLDLTVASYDKGKKLGMDDAVFQSLIKKHGMDEEMLGLYDLVEGDFATVIDDLEQGMTEELTRLYAKDEEMLGIKIAELKDDFASLRKINFFPLSRFGSRFVKVIALKDMNYEGREYKLGDMVSFETFESKRSQKKRLGELKRNKDFKVTYGEMNDQQKTFAGMPPQLLSLMEKNLALTTEQSEALREMIADAMPGQSFKKHMMHRKNVLGYSQDAMRGYGNYFLHFSNYLAQVKYKGLMEEAVKVVYDSAYNISEAGKDGTKRKRIADYLSKHLEYALNPGNEWANLRAIGFLWYLGFVPKSAFVNLTQVPIVTYPYLAARYGDAEAVVALGKAIREAKNYWRHPNKLSRGQVTMLENLINTGILDESMATELAGVAEGSFLQRIVPSGSKVARAVRTSAGWGAKLFQMAEQANRRVTALAAYNLAIKAGETHDTAVKKAGDAVEMTQFEYARWNRPAFSRGKASVLFLFWQYKQNALFFLLQDKGRARYMMMMLLAAGLAGLPFAEDLMDIYDYLAKKMSRATGSDYDKFIRVELRKFVAELGANPDLVMHGTSRYMFGLPKLANMTGIPMVNADISGSISMGRIFPGVEPAFGSQGNFYERLGKGAAEGFGAVANMPLSLLQAVSDDNPDVWKRFEKAMPSALRNMSKGIRFAVKGEETIGKGAQLQEFDLEDSYDRAAMIGQMLGFAPTDLQIKKEKYYMTKEVARYYEIQRRQIMGLLDYARDSGDKEMEAEVWQEIKDYNRTVPYSLLRLGPKDIRQSLRQRVRGRTGIEQGRYLPKRQVQVQRSLDEAFPDEEVP